MNRDRALSWLVRLALTLIMIGYLMVWLPQPAVGLSFSGQEMGEWVKFIPQVRSGAIFPGRELFFLPPITLGMLMLLWSTNWQEKRWQTWIFRGLAVFVTLLAAPPLEVIRFEGSDQWLIRILMIGLVLLMATLTPLWKRLPPDRAGRACAALFLMLGLTGGLLPFWAYLAVRPTISELFGGPVGIGSGLWISISGNMLIIAVGLVLLFQSPEQEGN